MLSIVSKLPQTTTNIFTIMSGLAAEVGAINLSQGFPDYPCDPKLVAMVNKAMKDGFNQYAPMPGLLSLRERIAAKANKLYDANYDPATQVTVTAGGTQAIFTAISAVINPNDEVIIFEPAYDCYAPAVKVNGGMVKSLELHEPEYRIDWSMVRKLITNKTRMIILNSPHNPTATVLEEQDITELKSIVKNSDIIILSDEVYEHLIFDGKKHLSMAAYPELRERSFIIASFGKLFHTTGWKLGYCLAPAQLMSEFRKVHQFNVFSVNTPMQVAAAAYLEDESHYLGLSDFFRQKRDYFRNAMAATKFDLLPCSGSYFQSVTYKNITDEKDTNFAIRLTKEFGVAGIPVSAFYSRGGNESVLRFCFAKKQETLDKAVEGLVKL